MLKIFKFLRKTETFQLNNSRFNKTKNGKFSRYNF